MDSSKRKDGEEKENGFKKLRTNLQKSSQVATISTSTGQGGSNNVTEGSPILPSTVLNDLPPEMIDYVANELSIMDCLNAQQAYANDYPQAVNRIQNGLAVNLDKQRALYLLMDTDEYNVKYQYNYQMESELPNAFLPTLEKLPISSESSKMITLLELERISIGRLKETFPKICELKIVLRQYSPESLTQLAEVVAAFSPQLTALQLLIFSDRDTLWQNNDLSRFISHLNNCKFSRLRHFTLLFEDMVCFLNSAMNTWSLELLSSKTLKECYLRLPSELIKHQLSRLRANQGLQQWGFIAYSWYPCYGSSLDEEILTHTSPSLAAKTVHLLFPWVYRSQESADSFYYWQVKLNQLEKYTSFRTLYICLATDQDYLKLMSKLNGLGSLTHLKIYLTFNPVSALTICQPLLELDPCSQSVTHLKIQVERIIGWLEGERLEFSHEIFTHLDIVRHFPNLQQLEVVFPRAYSCSLCEVTPGDDGRKCMEMAAQPFLALDQLKLSFCQSQWTFELRHQTY